MFYNKILSELILTESLKTAREFAEAAAIPDIIFKIADEIDDTPTKKLMHQILKWYKAYYDNAVVQYPENLHNDYARRLAYSYVNPWKMPASFVNKYLKLFTKLSGASITEPIEKFKTVDEFSTFMEPIYQAYREKQESKAKEVIYENDKMVIFRPLTKGAVCAYGFQTKWCITQEENTYYEQYRKQNGYTFYYAFSKLFTKKSNPFAKMALCIDKNGGLTQAFDNMDADIGPVRAKEWILDNDVPEEVFSKLVAVPVAFDEKWTETELTRYGIIKNDDGETFRIEGGNRIEMSFIPDFFDANGKLVFKFTTSDKTINVATRNCTTLENFPKAIQGSLIINQTSITTMEHCPESISGNLTIVYNSNLVSLLGCPVKVMEFSCTGNRNLELLEHSPKEVATNYNCSENNLRSLLGCPSVVPGNFICNNNPRLTSLGGGPGKVGEYYSATGTQITSLAGVIETPNLEARNCNIKTFGNPTAKIKTLNVSHNPLENLDGIPNVEELIIGKTNNPETIYPITNWIMFKKIPRIVINTRDRQYFAEFPRGYKTRFKFLNWT